MKASPCEHHKVFYMMNPKLCFIMCSMIDCGEKWFDIGAYDDMRREQNNIRIAGELKNAKFGSTYGNCDYCRKDRHLMKMIPIEGKWTNVRWKCNGCIIDEACGVKK